MKQCNIPIVALLLSASLLPAAARAGIFDRIIPKAAPDEAVTTSIQDARPIAHWLDGIDHDLTPQAGTSFNLSPGYYRFTVRSYCLHAGTYGPTAGDGYLLAPLKGSRSGMIRAILQRTVQHPDIKQTDVQQLIWSIEAGARFQDLPRDFAARVTPLLSPGDIASLNVDTAAIMDRLLPAEAKQALQFYQGLRAKLVDPATSFADLEKIAVLTGDAPWGKGSKRDIGPGNWSYAGNGFFIRTFPENYSTTVVEVLRPSPYRIERDAAGRIVRFESNGSKIEITYDDATGRNVISTPGKPDVPIWRFKSVHFVGAEPGEDYTMDGRGWVVPDGAVNTVGDARAPAVYSSVRSALLAAQIANGDGRMAADEPSNETGSAATAGADDEPTLAEYNRRVARTQTLIAQAQAYAQECRGKKFAEGSASPFSIRLARGGGGSDMGSVKNLQDGLKVALNPVDFKGKRDWIDKNTANTTTAFAAAAAALAGQETDDSSASFDAAGNVSTPANTSKQRLALSSFSK